MELALELFNGQGLGNQIFCITSLYKLSSLLKRKPVILNYCNYKGENFFPINKSIFKIKNNIFHNEYEKINDEVKEDLISGQLGTSPVLGSRALIYRKVVGALSRLYRRLGMRE